MKVSVVRTMANDDINSSREKLRWPNSRIVTPIYDPLKWLPLRQLIECRVSLFGDVICQFGIEYLWDENFLPKYVSSSSLLALVHRYTSTYSLPVVHTVNALSYDILWYEYDFTPSTSFAVCQIKWRGILQHHSPSCQVSRILSLPTTPCWNYQTNLPHHP